MEAEADASCSYSGPVSGTSFCRAIRRASSARNSSRSAVAVAGRFDMFSPAQFGQHLCLDVPRSAPPDSAMRSPAYGSTSVNAA